MNQKPMDYYHSLTAGGVFQVELSQEQAATVLKAHDHGITALTAEEVAKLDQVMSLLKDSIWP